MARQFAFGVVLIAFSCSIAFPADPGITLSADQWLGRKVFWKDGAKAKRGEQEVDLDLVAVPYPISEASDEWLRIGGLLVHKSDVLLPKQAVSYFTELIHTMPSSPILWLARGNAWREIGELDDALKDFDQAIRLNPNDAVAYDTRAKLWQAKGELDNAIQDFSEALRIRPKSGGTYCNRAIAWQAKGEIDNAIKDYDAAIQFEPNMMQPLNNSARLKATCPDERYRDGKEAVRLATKACEGLAWISPGLIDTLAAAYAETGDFENSIKWEKKAIAIAKDEAEKQAMKGRLELYKAGKPYREVPKKYLY